LAAIDTIAVVAGINRADCSLTDKRIVRPSGQNRISYPR
jgi:hypothetical protein